MTLEQVKALFLLAGIRVKNIYQTENNYWPDNEHYAQIRRDNPWWLVSTSHGLIHIGWRKRVISIDWSDTGIKKEITEDAVTKSETMVHAWSYLKALEYLTALQNVFTESDV